MAGRFKVANFFAGNQNNRDGVLVGAGDGNGDGLAEIIAVPVNSAAGAGGVYDRQGTLLTGFRAPTGFSSGIPVMGTGSTPNDISFNHGNVIRNVKGTDGRTIYTGSATAEVQQFNPSFHTQSTRIDITFEIQSMTPQTPDRDPAQSTAANPSFYDVIGRLTGRAAGVGSIDVQVTGTYRLDHFPTTFSDQVGFLSIGVPDPLGKSSGSLSGDVKKNGEITQITLVAAGFSGYASGQPDWGTRNNSDFVGVVLSRP